MSEKLSAPGPQHPHEIADIAQADIYGRGHRPDGSGKFMSDYEMGQVEVHQEQIRSDIQMPGLAELTPNPMSELLKQPENKSKLPAVGTEQAIQPDHGEVALVREAGQELQYVPDLETLGSEDFLQRRAGTLRGVWNKAKMVAGKIGDAFAVEQDGYRLSPMENIKARFANFGVLYRAITADTHEERREIVRHNPVVDAAVTNYYDRAIRQDRTSDENFEYATLADKAKIAAYELTTLPVVRMGGLMALHGAARAAEKITGSEKAGKIKDKLNYRLELHEQGLHNPTMRKLDGVKWKDIKPGSVPNPDQLPIVDPKKDNLSEMDDDTVIRVNTRNPFADERTPAFATTTVGRVRSRSAFEPITETPAVKIKAAADARVEQTVAPSELRKPFED